MRWAFANKKKFAREWAAKTKKLKHLPYKVGKPSMPLFVGKHGHNQLEPRMPAWVGNRKGSKTNRK